MSCLLPMIEIPILYMSNLHHLTRGSFYYGHGKKSPTPSRHRVCHQWQTFTSFIWAICITKGSCKGCEYLSWVTDSVWVVLPRPWWNDPPSPVEWYQWLIYKLWISIVCNKQDAVSCHHTYECLVQQRLSWMKRSRFPGVSCQRNFYR